MEMQRSLQLSWGNVGKGVLLAVTLLLSYCASLLLTSVIPYLCSYVLLWMNWSIAPVGNAALGFAAMFLPQLALLCGLIAIIYRYRDFAGAIQYRNQVRFSALVAAASAVGTILVINVMLVCALMVY